MAQPPNQFEMPAADVAIRPLELRDPGVFRTVVDLQEKAFPGVPGLDRQIRHNALDAPSGAVFLGAFDNETLIGVTGFVRHSINLAGRAAFAYQICSVATDPAYQRRGTFSRIIRHAQRELAADGAVLIGFPNELARPIYAKRLDFEEHALVKFIVPGVFIGALCASLARRQGRGGPKVTFDQPELIRWSQAAGEETPITVHRFSGVTIWGRAYRKRLGGLSIPAFAVGGIEVGEEIGRADVTVAEPGVLRRPAFYAVVTLADGELARTLRRWAIGRDAGAFIQDALQPAAENAQLEISAGIADYF